MFTSTGGEVTSPGRTVVAPRPLDLRGSTHADSRSCAVEIAVATVLVPVG
jgi:hypothetical protein